MNNNKKVILFNGAPRSGKDLFGGLLHKYISDVVPVSLQSFKRVLTNITLSVYDVSEYDWHQWYKNKESPRMELGNKSPRQALMEVSEKLIKPFYGDHFFGVKAANNLNIGVNIFTDSGFVGETQAMIDEVGSDNLIIIRLHREGFTFDGDSRNFISDELFPFVKMYDILSDDDHQATLERILKVIPEKWIL